MKLLVTGGAGFIGSNFVRYILGQQSDVSVVNLDSLTYAGNLQNLEEISSDPRYRFVRGDIGVAEDVERCLEEGVDVILNFAAETHVDRSILDASAFVRTNIQGTHLLLEAARRRKIPRFIQVSTDEVYGSLGKRGRFTERRQLAPNSPYAASKASADLLVRAYHRTYKMDTIVTRCSNNYGPFQFPEKLIPLMILNALDGKPLPVYGDGLYRRDWIHVRDHCRALETVLTHGRAGEVYNIGASQEKTNLEIVQTILDILGKPHTLIDFVKDRPGHDRRYAIDASRINTQLGWESEIALEKGLAETVRWYERHLEWVKAVRSGAYSQYYEMMYERREETLSDL